VRDTAPDNLLMTRGAAIGVAPASYRLQSAAIRGRHARRRRFSC
jgi:hypothetical protein